MAFLLDRALVKTIDARIESVVRSKDVRDDLTDILFMLQVAYNNGEMASETIKVIEEIQRHVVGIKAYADNGWETSEDDSEKSFYYSEIIGTTTVIIENLDNVIDIGSPLEEV